MKVVRAGRLWWTARMARMARMALAPLLALVAGLLVGCAPVSAPAVMEGPMADAAGGGQVSKTGIPDDLLTAVRADASRRSGLPADELVLRRAESMTWRDGALGCPQPGGRYAQVLTRGYWIVFAANGQEFDYRATTSGSFRLCAGIGQGAGGQGAGGQSVGGQGAGGQGAGSQGAGGQGAGGGGVSGQQGGQGSGSAAGAAAGRATGADALKWPQVKLAVADLAGRSGVQPDAVTVVSAEAVVWPDGGLGCPQPGMVYKQVQQDGMRIVLVVNGQQFEYHSGETRPPFLCEEPAAGPRPGVGGEDF